MTELNEEDLKLITLAKGARARIDAKASACVRDTDGRTYSAASVEYASKEYKAVDLAVAAALAAGAKKLEAICVLGDEVINLDEIKSVLQEAGHVIVCDAQGAVISVIN
jgi:cytidine deaminase